MNSFAWLPWRFRFTLWKSFLLLSLHSLEARSWRGAWIWVGHVGISFQRIPRFTTKLMIKRGAKKGIRVSQFGPLVVTWEEARG